VARPPKARTASELTIELARIARAVELDPIRPARRRAKLLAALSVVMRLLQNEMK
jgi:hypothetical protein